MDFLNSLKLTCENEKEAKKIYELILPEIQNTDRFSSKIERLKNIVVINIISKDAVALRSVLNSYLRILSMIEGIKNIEKEDE